MVPRETVGIHIIRGLQLDYTVRDTAGDTCVSLLIVCIAKLSQREESCGALALAI